MEWQFQQANQELWHLENNIWLKAKSWSTVKYYIKSMPEVNLDVHYHAKWKKDTDAKI